MTETPAFEEIPLDLSRVPSVELGLADAAERYGEFTDIARSAFGAEPGGPLFGQHLPYVSFINRASSLHKGVVSAVRESNPHAAFTLLRAYLELVVTVLYLDRHPDYIEALERPMAELPRGTRKRFSELFEFAAGELRGVRAVYASLNEMAHFGSSALWHPFTIEEEDECAARLAFFSGPRWREPDDARIALAMLLESDNAMTEVLRRYAEHHLAPLINQHNSMERIRQAFAAAGAVPADDERAVGTLPAEIGSAAEAAGIVAWCAEHDAFEVAEGVTAEDVDTWVAARQGSHD